MGGGERNTSMGRDRRGWGGITSMGCGMSGQGA